MSCIVASDRAVNDGSALTLESLLAFRAIRGQLSAARDRGEPWPSAWGSVLADSPPEITRTLNETATAWRLAYTGGQAPPGVVAAGRLEGATGAHDDRYPVRLGA